MRVLLTGGGTAGHVNPAIAIAQIIKERFPDAELAYVGTPDGMENRLVEAEGLPMYHVKSRGFDRSLSPKNLYSLWIAFTSPRKARKLLRSFKPDLVVGTGGYVSWPVLKAAAKEGIPCALHESNALPGVTVRMLAPHVDRLLLNFAATSERLPNPEKHMVVGNPLRLGFICADRAQARRELGIKPHEKLIVSFGGSLGSECLNEACLSLMEDFCCKEPQVRHIHGCGRRYATSFGEAFRQRIPDTNGRVSYREYLSDMPVLMSAADILITRAGAMTVSEIALLGKAAILIPSPNVTDNHQFHNANALASKNAALLIEEKDLTRQCLQEQVCRLVNDNGYRHTLEQNVRAFARLDANELILDELIKLVENKQ